MRKYTAEALGTFFLLFCGTGAVVINAESGGAVSHAGVAITFGLIVTILIYTLGDISGCHINPAVTLAFALAGRFSPKEVLPYIASQVAGALLASYTLSLLFPDNPTLGATLPSGSAGQSFVLEFMLTFLLMLVILRAATGGKEKGLFAGVTIGATVLLEALFAGPVSGASMNPARSLAPALVSSHTEHLWVYLAATTLGAVAAIPVWRFLKDPHSKPLN